MQQPRSVCCIYVHYIQAHAFRYMQGAEPVVAHQVLAICLCKHRTRLDLISLGLDMAGPLLQS